MMKKLMSIFLAVCLIFSTLGVFTACGGNDGIIEIKLGMWPDSGLGDDIAMFNKWKQKFEADYPEYRIVPSPYTYDPANIAFDAYGGTLPTVFQTYFTEPEKLISQGWIRDITDQMDALGWSDKMDPSMKRTLTRNGRLYGVPRDGYGMGLFINMEMLYEAGWLDKYTTGEDKGKYKIKDDAGNPLYPTTFEQLKKASIDVVDAYPAGTYGTVILSANKTGGWQFANIAWNFGLESFQYQEDGTWKSRLNAPEAVAALNWIKDMHSNELIFPDTSLTYTDWYVKIYQNKAAMAFAGSDAIANPVNNSGKDDKFNKDNIAFVPMPSIQGVQPRALFGGTPYVFANNATDKQVEGALKFLEYMGRSPLTTEISRDAIREGNEVAQKKGMPILPSIRPWINEDFKEMIAEFDALYVNVDMRYYEDFLNTIDQMKKDEEPHYCQEMYSYLDIAIQSVLSNTAGTPQSFLTTADSNFYNTYLKNVK